MKKKSRGVAPGFNNTPKPGALPLALIILTEGAKLQIAKYSPFGTRLI